MMFILSICFLMVTCVVAGPKQTEFDPLKFCKSHPTQLYAHPFDCEQFVICSNGYGYLQSCPKGTAFHAATRICNEKGKSSCQGKHDELHVPPTKQHPWDSQLTPHTRPSSHEERHSEPRDFQPTRIPRPNAGYSHDQPHGKPHPGFVPRERQEPRPPYRRRPQPTSAAHPHEMVHTIHVEVPFPGIEKGDPLPKTKSFSEYQIQHNKDLICTKNGAFPHPTDCTQYIRCVMGRAHITSCARGTYFHPGTRICGYDKSYCSGPSSPAQSDPSSEPEPWSRPHPEPHPEPETRGHSQRDHHYERNNNLHPELDWVGDRLGPHLANVEPSDIMRSITTHLDALMSSASRRTREIHLQEARIAKRILGSRRGAYSGVQAFLGSTPYVKQLSVPAFYQLEALRMIRDKYSINNGQFKDLMTDLPPFLKPNELPVSPDMTFPIPTMDTCPYPRNDENNECDPHSKYRTYDGSCNNLKRPLWGRSMRPLTRFLPPDYADGIGQPRAARSGRPLPSARAVTLNMFEDRDIPSHVHTLMHMTFGQFMDHDFSRAAVTKLSKDESGDGEMVDVTCGVTECDTRGPENRACMPIDLPYGDPDFSRTNKTCLMFVRTQEVPADNCKPGPREQLNQLTTYLDASMMYGNDKEQADKLRERSRPDRGLLKLIPHPYEASYKKLMPVKENKDCRDLNATVQCFTAGDGRINEHVGLSSTHTVFHRGHNTIERKLHTLNPHWSGERLYQETRKIMGAAMQYIFYAEYLPLLFGPQGMKQFGLSLLKDGYFEAYDDTISSDITNVFTTAAFRFGHSQVDQLIRFAHQSYRRFKDQDLSTVFRRPGKVYDTSLPGGSGVDSIMLGHISQPAQVVDRFFSKQITAHLFSESPPHEPGTDLPALNIQRGRDHGIPGYNEWREWCGLSRAKDFDDLQDIPSVHTRRQFQKTYESVDDIDLFPGAMTEQSIPGGMVGPTFACILGRQFRNTRVGDRFWHERRDPVVGFTPDQLREIRRFSFARIICDNLDHVDTIQRFVFLQPISEAFGKMGRQSYAEVYSLASLYHGDDNERRPCAHIPDPDLRPWIER